jgi:archaeosine-15-forming tRNA-guanine transglycosylase
LIAYGLKGPFREQLNELAMVVYEHAPHIELMIATPLGLLPYGLEDINPFAHTDPPSWALHQQPPDWWISDELKRLKCSHLSHICVNTTPNGWLDALLQNFELPSQRQFHSRNEHLTTIHTEQGISKVMLYLHLSRQDATSLMHGTTFFANKQGRLKNISSHDGRHILSPRLYDGGLSLTTEGAKDVFAFRSHPLPTSIPANSSELGGELGPAVVVVDEDAEPYVRSGRSVFHGFILAVDEWLLPDEPCLIVNPHGELIGHGISLCSATEIQTLRKGMAIKVRGGISPE